MSALPYPILRVSNLRKHYDVGAFPSRRTLVAVDGLTLDLYRGETLALVGESGSGKSTVARCVVRLVEPTSGSIEFDGRVIDRLGTVGLSRLYRRVQMVFQDPSSSLNPRMTVRQTVTEPLRLHLRMNRSGRDREARELMSLVGLFDEHLERFPHELSGGQRQRVGIARAIAVRPDVLILDEPTSSLDVSVRGQIIELLEKLQAEMNLAYLFITHDLAVVRKIAHRVAVMYLGGIVEEGTTRTVFANPLHPYTKALLSAAPIPEWGVTRERFRLIGEIPSPVDLPDTCRLVGRCPIAQPSCSDGRPPLADVAPSRRVACPVVAPALDLDSESTPKVATMTPR